ncbi:MAG: YgjV family protein [Bacilli bacterium]|nr:YgjV family protein [Bacilli bacterium]
MDVSFYWVLSQMLAFISLVFVIISFQQKGAVKLIIFRNIATFFSFVGLCFLGNISAIIMCGAGVIRNLTSLYFITRDKVNKNIKLLASVFIVILLIILNIIYWKDIYNIFSIVVGTMNVVTFMQENAKLIRKFSVVSGTFATIYCLLIYSPINALIELFGLVSAIVGIIRLDVKKR